MDSSKVLPRVVKQLKKLDAIQQMPDLMEEARKFLTHFIHLFQSVTDNVIEEYYFHTLYLCETSIMKCDLTERDAEVLHKILNTILEIINQEYVRKKVVIESLRTLHQIMCNLYRLEVEKAQTTLRNKIPFLGQFFCEKEHFGMMSSIVGILYQYVWKYDAEEREQIFADIMQNFIDPTNQLANMLQWTPETFYAQCRQYLNSIPGRKYYSLAAMSASFGNTTVIPQKDMPYISLEWNSHPSEVSMIASFDDKKKNIQVQANIDFSDICSLEIIEDLEHPRVLCTYEKITIEGITIATSELQINVLNMDELSELAEFVTPLLNSVKVVMKNVTPVPEATFDETVLVHEKFYNTMDFTSHASLQESNEPNPESADPAPESQIVAATTPKPDSPAPANMTAHENDNDEKNPGDITDMSASSTTNFQPFDTNWKTNLLQHAQKSKKTEHSLPYDPYDIELMRAEEIAQRKEKLRVDTGLKWYENGTKNGRTESVDKRPKYMQCSTPTKTRRTTLSKTLLNEELSSIGGDSSEELEDDEKNDATYIPYSMLSKVGIRGNRKASNRLCAPSARTLKPSKKLDTKMLATKRSAMGSRKGTEDSNRKTQICDISSSTPHVQTTTMQQAVVPTRKAPTCMTIVPYTMLPGGRELQNEGNTKGSELQLPPIAATCGVRKRVNSKHTTTTHTTKTTKTTTMKTTAVGLAACAVSGPAEDTTMQEDTITMPPSELLPCHATEQVHCRALYTVEKHQEYRVHHTVDEAESFVHALSEADRRQALAYARKIVDILTHGMNNTSTQ